MSKSVKSNSSKKTSEGESTKILLKPSESADSKVSLATWCEHMGTVCGQKENTSYFAVIFELGRHQQFVRPVPKERLRELEHKRVAYDEWTTYKKELDLENRLRSAQIPVEQEQPLEPTAREGASTRRTQGTTIQARAQTRAASTNNGGNADPGREEPPKFTVDDGLELRDLKEDHSDKIKKYNTKVENYGQNYRAVWDLIVEHLDTQFVHDLKTTAEWKDGYEDKDPLKLYKIIVKSYNNLNQGKTEKEIRLAVQTEFLTFKMKQNEDIQKYSERFKELVERLKSHQCRFEDEEDHATIFWQGLDDVKYRRIREVMHEKRSTSKEPWKPFQNCQEIMDTIRVFFKGKTAETVTEEGGFEETVYRTTESTYPRSNKKQQTKPEKSKKHKSAPSGTSKDPTTENTTQQASQAGVKKGGCYCCGESDHKAKFCPLAKRT
jgi:hypothetical protein